MPGDALERFPVVSTTTPLITLAGVGLLWVLPSLYGQVWIPDAVYDEYQAGLARDPSRASLDQLSWISIHSAPLDPAVFRLLDRGEAAAIALTRANRARLVLLDERRGRREAARLGLPIAGSLAVLVAAKERGLVSFVRPLIDEIVAEGRWISAELRRPILDLAGEDSK